MIYSTLFVLFIFEFTIVVLFIICIEILNIFLYYLFLLQIDDNYISKWRIRAHKPLKPHAVIITYLHQSGFYHVSTIGSTHIDSKLIIALLERWRPETHTFHLPNGECTITLEDVSILLGLPVDGKAANG